MEKSLRNSGQAAFAALLAAFLCTAGTAARAQVIYGANFDSADIVNGAPAAGFTPYSSPATGVDHLDGQNNWSSTDPYTGTTANGGTQVNGGADYVGTLQGFFGDTGTNSNGNFVGGIGGNQRNAAPTTSLPDVVPTTTSVSLSHPITVAAAASSLTLNVDFVLSSAVTFTERDSFSFSLQNAAGTASLIALNFVPTSNVTNPNGTTSQVDNVTTTVGTNTNVTTGSAVVLSSQYHLRLVVTSGANASYTATLTGTGANGSVTTGSFSSSLSNASITLANVARFTAGWTLAAGATATNGGYTSAGDNTLYFDNVSVVPEPSTYALVALGLFGLLGARRWQHRQA